jgi:ribosomal protein S3
MGQKIHPTGFRLALNKNWASRWYANNKNFPGMLLEDIKVRDFLKEKLGAPREERAHYDFQRAPRRRHRQER